MNKLFTKIATAFVGIAMAIGVGVAIGSNGDVRRADAADSVSGYTLVYENTCPENTKNKNYNGGLDETTVDGVAWYTTNINANANGDWRIGGKKLSSVTRVVYSKTGFTDTISKIRLKWTNTKTLSSFSVTATIHGSASDAASGTNALNSFTHDNVYAQNSYKDLDNASGWANCYLRISVSCTTSGTSNQCISLSSIAFYKKNGASTFSVTYNGNGNTGGSAPTDSTSYSSGATVTVKSKPEGFVKENCSFVEWNTSDDGTGTGYDPGETFTISATTTLYAIWNQVDFPVTYNKNGGTGTMTDSNSPYEKNDEVTVLANSFTAPAGKEFVEWNTKSDGSGDSYSQGDKFTITETTTLYAMWQIIVDDGSHITWDLSEVSYDSASETQVVWETSKMSMTADQESATTAANNYLPPSYSSTRFYKSSTLTFAVAESAGIKITSIVFTATTNDYATALGNSSWTNATAAVDTQTVTITPDSGKGVFGEDIVATIGANTGHTQVQITYEYLPAISISPTSIIVEANGTNTTTLSYDHFVGSGVPTITTTVTSGSALTASAVSQSGTTITVSAGANTGIVVFTLTGTISAESATTTLTVEVVASIIEADHIDVEEGLSVITYKGTDKALTITVLGENDEEASNQNVTCTSSNSSILTVTDAGVITPKAKGIATVTILDQDELCDPVVVNVRVRNKTVGESKEIGVLDLTDYDKASEGSTIASSHYTAKNSFASPTEMTLDGNYYAEDSCVRMGKSGGSGSITITFASTIKVAKVDIEAKLWSGDSGSLTVTNGSTTDSFDSSSYATASYSLSSAVSSITITAAGKPRFYVKTVTLYSERVDITSESDTQACYTFEETYMHLDDYNSNLGYCNDVSHNYYGKNTETGAKSHFNSLSPAQRSLFTSNANFADAWARLQAWAAANGESLNGSNQLASARVFPLTSAITNSNTSIIVIVTVGIAAIAIGGYFLLRKKKED